MQKLTDAEWRVAIGNWVKLKLQEKEIGLPELSRRLSEMGVELDRRTLSNKLNRVSFTAAFFMQLLEALGETNCDVDKMATKRHSGGESS